jgi:hypothetical protein
MPRRNLMNLKTFHSLNVFDLYGYAHLDSGSPSLLLAVLISDLCSLVSICVTIPR